MAGTLTATPSAASIDAPEPETAAQMRRQSRWLTMSSVGIGALNYLFALVLVHLLLSREYSVYAAGQSLLLVAGTAASASIPWVLAKGLARTPHWDLEGRRQAVSFALLSNCLLGLFGAGAVFAVCLRFSDYGTAALAGGSAALIFLSSTTTGYLQGLRRFRTIAWLRFGEAALKILLGLALVSLGYSARGALAAIGVGAFGMLVVGVVLMGEDLRLRFNSLRSMRLWRSAAGVGAVQGCVALLAAIDVVLVAVISVPDDAAATYQVSMILSRVPLFLAGALAMVVFPLLEARSGHADRTIQGSLRMLLAIVLPVFAIIATVPTGILDVVFPSSYGRMTALLPITAATGALLGAVNLITTYFQAESRFRRCLGFLTVGLGVQVIGVLGGGWLAGLRGLAIGSAAGVAITTILLIAEVRRQWGAGSLPSLTALVSWLPALVVLVALRHTVLWLPAAASIALVAAYRCFVGGRDGGVRGTDERLQVLHLAFEDHRAPGSGGGSIRTHEVNRRLAARHDVTVVTARYPGCSDRTEDGVRYVHVGLCLGRWISLLSYFVMIPIAIRRFPHDLVVEDFAAPFSSALVPLWDAGPNVAMVQWLFADEKSRQYHLPFFVFERLGLRMHTRFIAVSQDLADKLSARKPGADVTVVANGVQACGLNAEAEKVDRATFLGRLEVEQKGLDLLLAAFAVAASHTAAELVIAGDGPDAARVQDLIVGAGLEGRVRMVGRVVGREKWDLLASSQLVCMPSRYETFGIVAIEALAAGTPVLAFDVPCLRAVVPDDAGCLVPEQDVEAYARALVSLLDDPARCAALGERGRLFAAAFDWDEIADRQEEVYLQSTRLGVQV